MRAICRSLYERPDGSVLRCTFPSGHDGVGQPKPDHSWLSIKCMDAVDAAPPVDYTPQAVQAYLDSVTRGEMDAYLEAILAVAHSRKRAIRGVAGFRSGGPTTRGH